MSDVAAELRAALGDDPDRRPGVVMVSAELIRAACGEIHRSARIAESATEQARKLTDRVQRLSSANGSLIVDRDHGVREAAEREAAALALAQEAAAQSGDTVTEQRVAERRAYDLHVQALVDADREALDTFRMAVLGRVMAIEERLAKPEYEGREPELLRALIKTIEGDNHRYLKSPLPKWKSRSGSSESALAEAKPPTPAPSPMPVQLGLFGEVV